MTKIEHPWRNAPLHTFKRTNPDGKGFQWFALFYPYRNYTVFHHGKTEQEAIESAERMRDEAVAKHEAAYISRVEATKKAAETRKRKKELEGNSD